MTDALTEAVLAATIEPFERNKFAEMMINYEVGLGQVARDIQSGTKSLEAVLSDLEEIAQGLTYYVAVLEQEVEAFPQDPGSAE